MGCGTLTPAAVVGLPTVQGIASEKEKDLQSEGSPNRRRGDLGAVRGAVNYGGGKRTVRERDIYPRDLQMTHDAWVIVESIGQCLYDVFVWAGGLRLDDAARDAFGREVPLWVRLNDEGRLLKYFKWKLAALFSWLTGETIPPCPKVLADLETISYVLVGGPYLRFCRLIRARLHRDPTDLVGLRLAQSVLVGIKKGMFRPGSKELKEAQEDTFHELTTVHERRSLDVHLYFDPIPISGARSSSPCACPFCAGGSGSSEKSIAEIRYQETVQAVIDTVDEVFEPACWRRQSKKERLQKSPCEWRRVRSWRDKRTGSIKSAECGLLRKDWLREPRQLEFPSVRAHFGFGRGALGAAGFLNKDESWAKQKYTGGDVDIWTEAQVEYLLHLLRDQNLNPEIPMKAFVGGDLSRSCREIRELLVAKHLELKLPIRVGEVTDGVLAPEEKSEERCDDFGYVKVALRQEVEEEERLPWREFTKLDFVSLNGSVRAARVKAYEILKERLREADTTQTRRTFVENDRGGHWENLHDFDEAAFWNRVELVTLAEALKCRTISKGPASRYLLLHSIRKMMFRVVSKHPTFCIDQPMTAAILEERLRLDEYDPEVKCFLSGDYKAATDNIDPRLSFEAARRIAWHLGLDEVETKLLIDGLIGHQIWMGGAPEMDFPPILGLHYDQQRWGQLMGSPVSFPVLCLINAAVCRQSLFHGQKLRSCPLVINGDDIAAVTTRARIADWRHGAARAGLIESVGKTYESPHWVMMNSTMYRLVPEGTGSNPSDEDEEGSSESESEDEDVDDDDEPSGRFRLEEVFYLNLGEMYGLKRSGGKMGLGGETSGGWVTNLGARCRDLIRCLTGWIGEKDVVSCFIDRNRSILSKTGGIPWHLPEDLGGLGLPGEVSYRDKQALYLILRDLRDGRLESIPSLPGPESAFPLWDVADRAIRSRHGETLTEAEGSLDVVEDFMWSRWMMADRPAEMKANFDKANKQRELSAHVLDRFWRRYRRRMTSDGARPVDLSNVWKIPQSRTFPAVTTAGVGLVGLRAQPSWRRLPIARDLSHQACVTLD